MRHVVFMRIVMGGRAASQAHSGASIQAALSLGARAGARPDGAADGRS